MVGPVRPLKAPHILESRADGKKLQGSCGNFLERYPRTAFSLTASPNRPRRASVYGRAAARDVLETAPSVTAAVSGTAGGCASMSGRERSGIGVGSATRTSRPV